MIEKVKFARLEEINNTLNKDLPQLTAQELKVLLQQFKNKELEYTSWGNMFGTIIRNQTIENKAVLFNEIVERMHQDPTYFYLPAPSISIAAAEVQTKYTLAISVYNAMVSQSIAAKDKPMLESVLSLAKEDANTFLPKHLPDNPNLSGGIPGLQKACIDYLINDLVRNKPQFEAEIERVASKSPRMKR